jgi:hypothetical protein
MQTIEERGILFAYGSDIDQTKLTELLEEI